MSTCRCGSSAIHDWRYKLCEGCSDVFHKELNRLNEVTDMLMRRSGEDMKWLKEMLG